MSLQDLIKIGQKNWLLILLTGFLAAFAAFYLTKDQKLNYTSKAVVSTGIVKAFSIENTTTGNKIDREYTINEIENLISLATAYATMEELATRLLTHYMSLQSPDPEWLEPSTFQLLQEEVFTPEFRATAPLDTSYEATYQRLVELRQRMESNPVRQLLYSDDDYFGIDKLIAEVKVYRKGNSDLLQFVYTANDKAISKQTLEVLIAIFMQKHQEQKKKNSSSLVDFFAEAKQSSADQLKEAEQRLLDFQIQNNIINYYEQTRSIAFQKEDLDDLYFKEDMELQSAKASLTRLEEQLEGRVRLAKIKEGLTQKQQEYAQVAEKLAQFDILNANPASADAAERLALQRQLDNLKKDISTYVQNMYQMERTPEGINTQNLLNEWLQVLIEREESNARISIIEQRQQDFEQIYGQFAPWGSQLKKIEREINLSEEAYLENLHSYNQAMLHMQNNILASKLELLDPPYYPADEENTQRVIMVALALIGGMIMTFAALIVLWLLDNSMRQPLQAAEKIGLEVAGVLPYLGKKVRFNKKYARLLQAMEQSLMLIGQHIQVETLENAAPTKVVLLGSLRPQEGKSFLGFRLAEVLRGNRYKVLFLQPDHTATAVESAYHDDNATYFPSVWRRESEVWSRFDVVLIELPALLSGQYPVDLMQEADISFLVCHAGRSWQLADEQALKTALKAFSRPVKLVFNAVTKDALVEFLGTDPIALTHASDHKAQLFQLQQKERRNA
ncbi:MAG TPA: hypothetical protein PKA00_19525 [Saprospiraceae bacterium]|nr:hypothetical protein [Saprospiraceae bacterium]HMQ85110.1 hypothetical protein [Saprospiraceae bacterium]